MAIEDADEAFARKVREQREAHKWSQAELAEQATRYGLNFHATTIYKIEQNKRKVTIAEAVGLAHALRVSLHELMGQGVDSAFVAKEVLLEAGMEALIANERLLGSMSEIIRSQESIRTFLANFRDHFGEDPVWLAYSPQYQDLRKHWEPLANWDGPLQYLASWKLFIERTGRRYLDDLGWVDDRVHETAPTTAEQIEELRLEMKRGGAHFEDDLEDMGLDQIPADQLERENWTYNHEMPQEAFERFTGLLFADQEDVVWLHDFGQH